MFIDAYFHRDGDAIYFSRQQASDFAKQIADDFNPIHNIDAKRFCVPGDLLFAVTLRQYGLYEHMQFEFSGMVSEATRLHFPARATNTFAVTDANNKACLNVAVTGGHNTDESTIAKLVQKYVTFSGHTFPHILVPLLAEQNVMINPARPIVMYESMLIELNTLALNAPKLVTNLDRTKLTLDGKRGKVCLAFDIVDDDSVKGRGEKQMVLSGLCAYDEAVVNNLIDDYVEWKNVYLQSH